MGRKKQQPRYNVLSCRVSDAQLAAIRQALGGQTIQHYLIGAITEKVINDRQAEIDELFRSEP